MISNFFREVNEDNVLFRNVLVEFEESFKYVRKIYISNFNYKLILEIVTFITEELFKTNISHYNFAFLGLC